MGYEWKALKIILKVTLFSLLLAVTTHTPFFTNYNNVCSARKSLINSAVQITTKNGEIDQQDLCE